MEKNKRWKLLSVIMVLIKTILFDIICYLFLDVVFSFIFQSTLIQNTLLKYLSLILSILGILSLSFICYLEAHLLNLTIPNKQIPWSESLATPQILDSIFKFGLIATYILKNEPIAFYISLTATLIFQISKIFMRVLRSYMFNRMIFKIGTLTDFTILHLLLFVYLTDLIRQQYLFFFVALPVVGTWAFTLWLLKYSEDKMIEVLMSHLILNN